MANPSGQKPVHSIIVDTGPLIKNTVAISTIVASAEHIYSTPAIISEIRDAATRSRVETTLLPFLNIKNPSPASYEAVAAFAKKTGDFAVLSRQDLGILALAYQLHCEKNGGPWGLRDAPKGPLKQRPGEQKISEVSTQDVEGQAIEADGEATTESTTQDESQPVPSEGQLAQENSSQAKSSEEMTTSGTETTERNAISTKQPQEQTSQKEDLSVPTSTTEAIEQELSNLEVSESVPPIPQAPEEDGSSDGEWITPTNISKHQAKNNRNTAPEADQPQMDVATMTTDFAMQNVLLQMNLHLLSTNMQRIRRIRTYVLRCHACFATTKEMTKQFCPRCGQPTLNRVACSTNAKGEFHIHLAKNYQYNRRGDRYSVPKPVGGSANGKHQGKGGGKGGWGKDLIFTEDQKEYTRQIDEGKRSKTRDLMDEDYLPSILSGDRGRAGGRPKVGAGKNINSRKRF